MRCDARPCAALGQLSECLANTSGLERAQSSVNRALMIEGETSAEVRRLHQGDRQPTAGRIVGREEPVNTPANHDKVVPRLCDSRELSGHGVSDTCPSAPARGT